MNIITPDKTKTVLMAMTIIAMAFLLTGCQKDVERYYEIPQAASDCPADTDFRSGGGGVIDRSGGGGVIDRDDNPINQYCEPKCMGSEVHVGDPDMIWSDKNTVVFAKRPCQ